MIPQILPSDIGLVDSQKTGAKIVKYLMRSATLWQDIWRMINHEVEKPLYYHAFMFLSENNIIEQQWKVQIKYSSKVLDTSENLCIIRYKNVDKNARAYTSLLSKNDLGKKWDVLNAFGKFFTWLVGFKWFARRVEFPSQDICINRVIKWWIIGFGAELRGRHYSEWTTHSFYKYVKNNPDKFEIVYEKFKHE